MTRVNIKSGETWLPFTAGRLKRAEQAKKYEIAHVFNPKDEALLRLKQVWEYGWKQGIDENNPCAPLLRETLLADLNQIKMMHENSWENILVTRVEGEIEAAIWGNAIDLERDPKSIANYDRITQDKTFRNSKPEANSRFCVSVVVNPAYNGFKTENGISLGQEMVLASLKDVARHPYQADAFAYSRPSSLSRFVELVWGINRTLGYKILYDHEKLSWVAEYEGEKYPAVINENGIKINERLIKTRDLNPGKICISDLGYVLEPKGLRLFTDEKGVYLADERNKEYLVEIGPYLASPFDQMARFHGGRGGEIKAVFPQSRVSARNPRIGDPSSLNYNIVFKFPMGQLIGSLRLFKEIFRLFTPSQRRVMGRAILDPAASRKKMEGENSPKELFEQAFSREKMGYLLNYIERNQKKLLEILKGA